MNILIILALLLPRSEAAQESDEGEARRLLFRRSELLGRPSLPSPWLSAHDAFGRTYGLPQILWLCSLGFFFFFLLTFGLGLLLAQASLIILPGEAGAAVRASASLDAKNCLFHALARTYAHFFISILYVNFQFGSNEYILIVWHSSSPAAKLLRRVTRAEPDVYSN